MLIRKQTVVVLTSVRKVKSKIILGTKASTKELITPIIRPAAIP
jgi:hypothetical protein